MAKLTKEKRGVTICWHCLKHLMWAKGGGVMFKLVVDPAGIEHRVHHQCVSQVVGDGVREVKSVANV